MVCGPIQVSCTEAYARKGPVHATRNIFCIKYNSLQV